MNEVKQKKRAAIYANDEFVCVQTESGFRRSAGDPEGELIFLLAPARAEELGGALRAALSKSRMLTPEETATFFELKRVELRYEEWVSLLIQRFSYHSRRALFKNMMHCFVECADGSIVLAPTLHEKLEAWSGTGLKGADHIRISEGVQDGELGDAALLALSRCVGR